MIHSASNKFIKNQWKIPPINAREDEIEEGKSKVKKRKGYRKSGCVCEEAAMEGKLKVAAEMEYS